MKVLVLGANGMLGSRMIRVLSENDELDVFGTVRDQSMKGLFSDNIATKILANIDVSKSGLGSLIEDVCPDVVINCVGSVNKNFSEPESVLQAISLNALLPHRLYKYCERVNSRLIHISTDCVFSGNRGNYTETDPTDPIDIYGRSKLLGEVIRPNVVTLRTSIIGPEFRTSHGLLEWFLSQEGKCKGYANAVFSGLPTVILAKVIHDYILLNSEISGLYHVAGPAISKYDLLNIIAKEYNKNIDIDIDTTIEIDRSLNADKFQDVTGYIAPDWSSLIKFMHNYN